METTLYDWPAKKGKIIHITGEVDLYSSPTLFTIINNIIEEGVRHFHLDFSGVEYLDSSGVGTIIKTLQTVKNRGIVLTFSGIRGTPRKVLSMANILPLLQEIPSPEECSIQNN